MKIIVTKQDIKCGKIGEPKDCAVALALRRQLNLHRNDISVSTYNITIKGKCFRPSKKLYYFIRNFDQKEEVRYGTFAAKEVNLA